MARERERALIGYVAYTYLADNSSVIFSVKASNFIQFSHYWHKKSFQILKPLNCCRTKLSAEDVSKTDNFSR